ncbi:MAG: hypothetical protein JST54_22595 [Deltaproteobacteria bacterium]|nr:hypothetical protein [Deltaproteobacteria bacterium]
MLTDRAKLPADVLDALARELAPLRMLDEVLRWGFAQSPPRDVADIVIQDEYTHDVVLPWRDELHLVFGTT